MMMNKRLIHVVSDSKKYIAGNVAFQWMSLVANIGLMVAITLFLKKLFQKKAGIGDMVFMLCVALFAVLIRFLCTIGASKMGYLSSQSVKCLQC